jgi:CubicO group peptidase (beta-lactamase class C family)
MYVPTFPAKRWSVSTRQLLGHLGGIRHYRRRELFSTTHYTNILAPLSIFKADPLEHEPGTKYLYSTYGYTLVGAVVEAAAQEKFTEYVRHHVFTPAGMENTQVDDPAVIIPNLATGYVLVASGGLTEAPAFDATNKIPGGGFVSTAKDMAHYAVAVMTDRLLRPGTKDAMWMPQKTKNGTTTRYGLGWALGQWAGERTAAHSGGQPGVTTLLFLVPARGCAVIVLTNRGGVRGMSDLARGIADIACQ